MDRPHFVLIPGYTAGTRWDAVTGIGTPKVSTLAALLAVSLLYTLF